MLKENEEDSLKLQRKRVSETTILVENLDQSSSPDQRDKKPGVPKNWSSIPILINKKQPKQEKVEEKETEDSVNKKKLAQIEELMRQIQIM